MEKWNGGKASVFAEDDNAYAFQYMIGILCSVRFCLESLCMVTVKVWLNCVKLFGGVINECELLYLQSNFK